MIENREKFLERLRSRFILSDVDEIMFAYDLAKAAHRGQKREQGERYFEHKRACALIMMDELDISDKTKIIAILLHDTGEDTEIFGNLVLHSYTEFARTLRFRIERVFSSRIAELVLRLTKPREDKETFSSKSEIMDFYVKGVLEDDECCMLKMVDILHNLRTLSGLPEKRIQWGITKTEKYYSHIMEKGKEYQHGEKLFKKIQEQIHRLKENKIN